MTGISPGWVLLVVLALTAGCTAGPANPRAGSSATPKVPPNQIQLEGPPFHLVYIETSSSYKNGYHADCFDGPVYRLGVDRSGQTLRIDADFFGASTRERLEAANVVVARLWHMPTQCGSDNLTLAAQDGAFSLDLDWPWRLNVTTRPDGLVFLDNGTRLDPGAQATIRHDDATHAMETQVYNGGLWPRSAIRLAERTSTGGPT